MISILYFIGITLLLIAEGWLLLSIIGVQRSYLKFFLSLPTATLPNTLIILIITLANFSLIPTTIIGLHLIFILAFYLIKRTTRNEQRTTHNAQRSTLNDQCLTLSVTTLICLTLLLITFIYSASHSIILPTFHYDSAMNWNMRSKISFTEKRLVLTDHHELIAKPHYPFLYHALQITTQQGQNEWNDRLGNLIHFILSLSILTALFLIMKKLKGFIVALTAITIIVTTPLFAMHLGGSYADVPLTLFALLSLSTFFLFKTTGESKWIILSAIFVSSGVWTKSEGLPFLFIPWLIIISLYWFISPELRSKIKFGIIIVLILSLLWPVTTLIKGLPLSPHGSKDIGFALRNSALPTVIKVIFAGGSFGVVLPLTILISIFMIKKNIYGFLWGFISLFGILFVYIFTSNAQYLINGQSFDRQLLLPISILILSIANSLNMKNLSK